MKPEDFIRLYMATFAESAVTKGAAASLADALARKGAAREAAKLAPRAAAKAAAREAAKVANSQPLPNLASWPRLLSRKLAAAYVGLSIPTFEAEVKNGDWPSPQRHGRRVLYDRAQLDRALDIRAGLIDQSAPSLGELPWETS